MGCRMGIIVKLCLAPNSSLAFFMKEKHFLLDLRGYSIYPQCCLYEAQKSEPVKEFYVQNQACLHISVLESENTGNQMHAQFDIVYLHGIALIDSQAHTTRCRSVLEANRSSHSIKTNPLWLDSLYIQMYIWIKDLCL